MNIEEFLYFRSFLRDQVVMSANGQIVNVQDFLALLSMTLGIYGNPQDSAYNPSFTGGGGTLTFSIMNAINFIIQTGDLTAAQYTAWQNAGSGANQVIPVIKGTCRMDGTEDKQITTADFLIFLGVYTQSQSTPIDPDSSAFNF